MLKSEKYVYAEMHRNDYDALIKNLKEDEDVKTKEDVLQYLDEMVGIYDHDDYIPKRWLVGLKGVYRYKNDYPVGQPTERDMIDEIIHKWNFACSEDYDDE